MSAWSQWMRAQLADIKASGQWRRTIPFDGSLRAIVDGREVVNFAANDYLGLAQHPCVRDAAREAIAAWGTGAGGARLVTGTRSLHAQLESQLAHWKRQERALVFPTGYAANLGAITALGTAGATIFSDALNHASIIDGCRLAKARTMVFAHNDVEALAVLMRDTPGRKLVVTEAIFSMDGDAAPLRELADLCARHDALLVIDEAHAAKIAPATQRTSFAIGCGATSMPFGRVTHRRSFPFCSAPKSRRWTRRAGCSSSASISLRFGRRRYREELRGCVSHCPRRIPMTWLPS